jgi:predicted component of type VI protein secretion system
MRQAAAEIRSLRAQMEQEQERVGIVAWLRGTPHGNWQAIANAIERHEDKEPSA